MGIAEGGGGKSVVILIYMQVEILAGDCKSPFIYITAAAILAISPS